MTNHTLKYPIANKCHILNCWENKPNLFIFRKEPAGANVLLKTDAEHLN
jgi:hypothetical protein